MKSKLDKGLSRFKLIFLLTTLFSSVCFAEQEREIAITIDDLPLVASQMNTPNNQKRSIDRFNKIIEAFTKYKVPATGFVIAGAIEKGQWSFLEEFRKAGLMLGNHTYSHYNLNQMSAEKYIADVDKADKILTPLMTEPKYFRYPYLAEGNKNSKPKVHDYLTEHHYTIAPVTIDSKDFNFNEMAYKVPFRVREAYILKKLKPRYLDYIWKQTLRAENRAKGQSSKQILLIHANLINSYLLGDVLEMYQKNGYKFISLTEALKNPAPALSLPSPADKGGTQLEDQLLGGETAQ
ncbi:polysaccharide deacetylase family protein [Legionella maioricensis]|uniref:Polysaccharide deacetylase family protein n=1 Tax=Legionella maioricensis TaxID=2896528 RepID=A0A9X2D258_9GAMM|nr:polysaccharide deacetylase family protein [Legionella maioricensis]MCL9685051.1 polysaccharide deacetylase family protein [Legionella maioricensis]MCL9688188.1 polysaccharide deacetylase family protein [Legionella maioricensis]